MWEDSQSSEFALGGPSVSQWSALIGGLRWYRWKTADSQLLYVFVIEDTSAASSLTNVEDLDADFAYPNDWHDDTWWASSSNFPPTPQFWSADLTTVAEPEVHEVVDEQLTVDAPSDDPVPDLAVNLGQRLSDPVVSSAREARYTKRGAFTWPVQMTVQDVQQHRSWIIQKVVLVDKDGTSVFWEAFVVEAGQSQAAHQDIYQSSQQSNSGKVSIEGLMQHHEFGGSDPPGMTVGGSHLCDDEQMATDSQPAFWGDGGTAHNFSLQWTLFGSPECATVPDSDRAEVGSLTELGFG